MQYKISQFANLMGISVKTLRYYDSIDLFKPAEIDLFSNYRYYNQKQIDDLKLILTLKDLGFTLSEIKNNWQNLSDEFFINQKSKILRDIENSKNNIKKIDDLRSRLKNGKISKESVLSDDRLILRKR